MSEYFNTSQEAKVRRNQLLDESSYAQRPSFAERYTRESIDEFLRYDRELYRVVDEATFPGNIEFPSVPVPTTHAEYYASLPNSEDLFE